MDGCEVVMKVQILISENENKRVSRMVLLDRAIIY